MAPAQSAPPRGGERVFTIRAEATTTGGARFIREVVVEITRLSPDTRYGILDWRRGR